MAQVIGVLLLAAATFGLEMPGLRKRKRKREKIAFMLFLLTGTALYAALVMNVELPNPFLLLKLPYTGE
ncbi:hypothetical protein [Paenibacillus sp. NPDC058071]|uniref:hypothetical protein n=1 Tax=Paenibacillus sp. NPDC058071 TaxID=3346326 RepID=UPI0036DABF55